MIVYGGDYEHTLDVPRISGGYALEYTIASRPDLFAKVLQRQDFGACEFSLSNYIMMRDRGDDWLTAIPVFPARAFRHGTILVRREDPTHSFYELKGRRVGIPDYTMTAGVWCRGILADEFGVHWSDLRWLSTPTPRIQPPDAANVAPLSGDMEDALASGSLDALLLPSSSDALLAEESRRFRPLLRDWKAAEVSYLARTGIFPISHVVVIANRTIECNPGLPSALLAAYCRAMSRAKQRRLATTFLPWGNNSWDQTMQVFGYDPLQYGLNDRNRAVVDKLQDYLIEQQLIGRRHSMADLFVGVDTAALAA